MRRTNRARGSCVVNLLKRCLIPLEVWLDTTPFKKDDTIRWAVGRVLGRAKLNILRAKAPVVQRFQEETSARSERVRMCKMFGEGCS